MVYRIPAAQTRHRASGTTRLRPFVRFGGTPLQYGAGFNVNGIVVTPDKTALVVVQTNTGRLLRIDLATRRVTGVGMHGRRLLGGDGMLLQRRTLYVVSGAKRPIVKLVTSSAGRHVRFVGFAGGRSLKDPTTLARAGRRLLVVNSQFSERTPGGHPDLPFTVSVVATSAALRVEPLRKGR